MKELNHAVSETLANKMSSVIDPVGDEDYVVGSGNPNQKGNAIQWTEKRKSSAANSLHRAVVSGNVEKVGKLLAGGVDADAWGMENADGDLPLQAATRSKGNGALTIVGMLLDAGADVDNQGDYGATALHRAVYSDRNDGWAMARLLVRRGAAVSSALYDRDALNAAEAALTECNEGAVLAMLEAGMDPCSTGPAGPLIWYAAWDSPMIVAKLLELGVPHDGGGHVCPFFGKQSPVLRAAESLGCKDEFDPSSDAAACLLILLNAGASLDETNSHGKSGWDLLRKHAGAVRAMLDAEILGAPDTPAGSDPARRRI